MTNEPSLTTRTIGETESALNGVLQMVLDGTGIDETGWVASRLVSFLPPPVTVTALSDQLRHSKKVDDDRVLAVLQDLELLGLLKREDGLVSLTMEGTRRFQQISDQINEFTNQMWDGLGSDELATAARVLTTITQRANEILAA